MSFFPQMQTFIVSVPLRLLSRGLQSRYFLTIAGVDGFEPPMSGLEADALPLGDTPMKDPAKADK